MEFTMRTKILAAIVLGGSVLGFQASALAAQDVTTHHRAVHAQKQTQQAPRYYDEYYDQSQNSSDSVGRAGSAIGGIGR
jgi:hypothetical protein